MLILNDFNTTDYIIFPIIKMEYSKVTRSVKNRVPPHSHSYVEIEYIISGEAIFNVNGKKYNISAGNLVLIAAGDIHHTTFSDNAETEILIFSIGNQVPNCLFPNGQLDQSKVIAPKNQQDIDFTIKRIIVELIEGNPYYKNIIEAKILTLLYQILRDQSSPNNIDKYPDSFSGLLKLRKEQIVSKVIHQINDNIGSNIKISEIAAQLFFTPQYLTRIFKETTGMSPKQYELNNKISAAKSMLTNSDESVKTIAEKLGYDDVVHFCKIFKKHTGYTPSSFRNDE